MKKLLLAILSLFVLMAFNSCGGDDNQSNQQTVGTWTITYDKNGFDGIGVPTRTRTVTKGQPIGAVNIPVLNPSDNFNFGGWATTTDGVPINALYVPQSDITLYVISMVIVDDGLPITIKYNANGWGGDMPDPAESEGTSGTPIGKADLPRFDDTNTQKFIGWALTPSGEPLTLVVPNSNITLYVIWESVSGPPPEPVNNVEKILLGHGGTALYKFVLPEGNVWEDYRIFAVDIKLTQEGLDTVNISTNNTEKPDEVIGVRHFRLYGVYAQNIINEKENDRLGTPYISMAGSVNNNSHIMDDSHGTDYVLEYFANEDGSVKDEWVTVFFDITGNSPPAHKDFTRLPRDDAEGPFWFGVGISGQEGESNVNGILQYIKNPRLVGYAGYGITYGSKPDEGEPYFVAWNAPIVRCWRGGENDDTVYPAMPVDTFDRGTPPSKDTLTKIIELDIELPYQHGTGAEAAHQKGWLTGEEDSEFTILALQKAWYLVIEVTELPQGGGNLAWVLPGVDNTWLPKAAFASGSGSAAHDGIVIDTSAKTIEILLPKSILMYGDLYNDNFTIGKEIGLVLTYNGVEGENTVITLADWGITRAYLMLDPADLE